MKYRKFMHKNAFSRLESENREIDVCVIDPIAEL